MDQHSAEIFLLIVVLAGLSLAAIALGIFWRVARMAKAAGFRVGLGTWSKEIEGLKIKISFVRRYAVLTLDCGSPVTGQIHKELRGWAQKLFSPLLIESPIPSDQRRIFCFAFGEELSKIKEIFKESSRWALLMEAFDLGVQEVGLSPKKIHFYLPKYRWKSAFDQKMIDSILRFAKGIRS